MTAQIIEKEHIGDYKIIPAEVDNTTTLYDKLSAAQRLGNQSKSKTTMVFQTEDGPRRIETTVWSLTEPYSQTKNGVLIPFKSIIKVDSSIFSQAFPQYQPLEKLQKETRVRQNNILIKILNRYFSGYYTAYVNNIFFKNTQAPKKIPMLNQI